MLFRSSHTWRVSLQTHPEVGGHIYLSNFTWLTDENSGDVENDDDIPFKFTFRARLSAPSSDATDVIEKYSREDSEKDEFDSSDVEQAIPCYFSALIKLQNE